MRPPITPRPLAGCATPGGALFVVPGRLGGDQAGSHAAMVRPISGPESSWM